MILMLYHYNDNDNVLLLKMFQILGKYNIEFKYAPTFNDRKVVDYSRGALLKYFSSKGGRFVPYRGDFYTELTPGLEIYIGVNTVYFASIWYRVKKRN